MAEPNPSMLESAAAGAKKLGDAAKKAATPIEKMNAVFEQLSITGNTFGNDMIKMQMAATNARMPLDKFAELLQSNNEIMGTLGTSVGKGSQVFSDLAKAYHASGLTENLRQMGFTTGELNEILALTVGFQKSTYENTREGQAKAAASAAQFAMELDQLTQLTGVSRKEQEDNLKKAQADMKLEAKFRLIGLEKGETAEAEARAAFKNNYAQMAAKGMGDLYKEYFATGTAMSKAAQTQMGMYGQAGMNAAKSATELSRGNTELAKTYQERAGIEAMKLQRDKAFLTTAIYAGSDVGEASRALMKANDTAYHGMRQSAKDAKLAADDVAGAMRVQLESIKKEQEARSGITQSIRTLGIVIDDVRAAASTRILGELNRKGGGADVAGRKASEAVLMTKPGENPMERGKAYADALRKEEEGAKQGKFTPASRQSLIEGGIGLVADPITKGLNAGAMFAVNSLKDGLGPAITKGLQEIKQIEVGKMTVSDFKTGTGRAGGTLGETGNAIETKDVMALLHKGETVLTPEQQKNLMSNIRTEAIGDVINKLTSTSNKTSDLGKLPGIDIQKLAKTLATTASKVEVTNWPQNFGVQGAQSSAEKKEEKKAEDKKEDKKADDKKSDTPKITEAEARKIWEEKQKDLNNQIPTQASVRQVDNKIEGKTQATQSQVREVDNKIDAEMPSLVNLFIKDQEDELEKAAEQFQGVFKEMIPIQEMQGQQSEFRSKFTEEQKKFIEDYQGMSKDNQDFMTFALKRQHDIDAEIIEKHDAIVADLQKKKNERELTEEEEAKLADSKMISARAKEEYAKSQEQLDMIKNIETLADDLELERLDQQARKELELMKGSDADKIKQSETTNDLLTQQFLEANQQMIGSVGGLTDAALEARESFMQEINEMFDMPSEVVASAQDSMMQELNEMFDMPSQIVADAQDSMMQELNEMFDMPSQIVADAQDSMMQELNEMFDMPERDEFAEDEYGEGGEDIAFPEEPEENYIGLALKEFTDQVAGLKEFEEDEYGEGGEAIGGGMDSGFAEDEYGVGGEAVNQAAQNLADQIQGLKEFEEDEYGAGGEVVAGEGPGDSSVAGFDASEPLAMSNNFVDFGEARPSVEEGQADVAPISMGDFTMGPDGLPIPKPRSAAKSIPSKEDQSDAETKRLQKQNDANKEDKAKKDSEKDDKKNTQTATEKQATKTLDDVHKVLESLNTNMNRLIGKVEETSKAQVSAVKANSSNLYNR
jgi:hypothetical protein